uniref:Uncharacterized protein n=1 Tax=Aegilops tauschii TaxID=37682 RepID=N1R2L8_AEGTA
MRDNDGNTALHLAAQAQKLRAFCSLFANKKVHLSIANNQGRLQKFGDPNSDNLIHNTLKLANAKYNCLREDHIEEKDRYKLTAEETTKEAENVKDLSQMIGIGSVLIATVAFGATFAVPGGFVADDHTNRGTPTLAGRYTFDAFMTANALAFICSSIVTIGLMFSGSSMHNLVSRRMYLSASWFFMASSVTSLSAAFALGVYMVLAPVAHATAIVICVLSPLVVLYRNFEILLKLGILARPLYVRMGPVRASKWLAMTMIAQLLRELWPFILIFGWAAIAQKLRNH